MIQVPVLHPADGECAQEGSSVSENRQPVSAPGQQPAAPAAPGRTLDRAALERVLARAAELQAGSADTSETMTEAQLVELGKEVGLSVEHLRQAIAEERTRVAVGDDGGGTSLFGPASAAAQRIIRGTQAEVFERLERWMSNEECLQVRRRYADRVTWEARRDFLGNLKRGFNFGGRGYALTRADEVGATVVPVDESRVLVRVDAAFGGARQRSVTGASALAGVGVVGAGGVITLAAVTSGAVPIAAVIGGVWMLMGGAGFAAVARSHRSAVLRAQLALEQVLDRLEHGEPRRNPSLLDVLAGGRMLR